MAWSTSLLLTATLAVVGNAYAAWERRVRSLPRVSRVNIADTIILAALFVILCTTTLHPSSAIAMALLTLASIVDTRHQIIPNRLLVAAAVFGVATATITYLVPAFLVGSGLITLNMLYKHIRGAIPLGGGDVKLLAVLTGFVGWTVVGLIYIASALLALNALFQYLLGERRVLQQRVAFAPYLTLAYAIVLFLDNLPSVPW